jgi:hypothetical protein
MRDIRTDLEERAQSIDEQIRAAHAWFDKTIQQLQRQREERLAELQGTLAAINTLIQFENGATENVVTLENNTAPSHSGLADRIRAAGS